MGNPPVRAVLLARISDARNGDDHGVAGQLADMRRYARRLGWAAGPAETHEITENDTSAFKRRMVTLTDGSRQLRTFRPGFRRALAMLRHGAADGLIALDLDRACRDPRDLEDLIDVVEGRKPRLPVESVTGSLRLATDADITMARVMVAVANKSSRDTARRVAAARARQAAEGRPGGGGRCFGYTPDGLAVIPAEAAAIRAAADAVLAGASLRAITRDWTAAGITTTRGKPWRPSWLRSLLLRPRLAGIAVYQREEVGAAAWPAILDEGTWRTVRRLLTDPGRLTARGNEPKWLGSGLYACGVCGEAVTTGTGGRHGRTYVCPRHHIRRTAAPVDQLVTGVVTARLALPDAAEAMAPKRHDGPDTASLHRQAAALRSRLDEQAALHARGGITTAQLATGTRIIAADLAAVESQLATVTRQSPLTGIAGHPDAAAVWQGLPLWRQREIVRVLMNVRLMPSRPGRQPGGGYFDPASVRVEWRHG
jgi:DNA invertase Pin-like site-specific DNA recombinase